MKLSSFNQTTLHTDVLQDDEDTGRYELVSAALLNYLPSISFREHRTIYEQIIGHRNQAVQEQDNPTIMDRLTCEGQAVECLDYIQHKPAILCTMHTGSYRILNRWLIEKGINFKLVIGNAVLEKQGASLLEIFRSFNTVHNLQLQLINAEQADAGLKMLRALRSGISLVLYLDGQSGAGVHTNENENNCVIDFLNQQLYVRKGIPYLAHAAGVPIFPVASYRNSVENIRLLFFPVIHPGQSTDRNEFAMKTTQFLYNSFAKLIAAYPEQWEGWLTIHKNIKLLNPITLQKKSKRKKGQILIFNQEYFSTFRTGGLPFLLDKRNYLFYPLDEELFYLLQRHKETPSPPVGISEELLNLLLEMNVVLLL